MAEHYLSHVAPSVPESGQYCLQTIMRDRLTQRPRGFGFLTYVDESVAERVVRQAHSLDGRQVQFLARADGFGLLLPRYQHGSPLTGLDCLQIDAKRSVPQEQRPRSKKIFVGGLAPDTTDGMQQLVTRPDRRLSSCLKLEPRPLAVWTARSARMGV